MWAANSGAPVLLGFCVLEPVGADERVAGCQAVSCVVVDGLRTGRLVLPACWQQPWQTWTSASDRSPGHCACPLYPGAGRRAAAALAPCTCSMIACHFHSLARFWCPKACADANEQQRCVHKQSYLMQQVRDTAGSQRLVDLVLATSGAARCNAEDPEQPSSCLSSSAMTPLKATNKHPGAHTCQVQTEKHRS